MKTIMQFIIIISIFFCQASLNAQDNFPEDPTFHFDLNAQDLTPEYTDHWEGEYAYGSNDFHDETKKVLLHSYSISGNDKYNKSLARERANAIKEYLVQKGVQASRVETIAYGETTMAEVNNNYFEDDQSIRQVIVTFEDLTKQAPADPIHAFKNKKSLQFDILMGRLLFTTILEVEIAEIKKNHQMVRKVFLQNPSADREELKDQVWGVLKDMSEIDGPKALAEFSAKIGLDAFIDLFTSLGAREINKARQAQYDIIVDALTSEVFPNHEINTRHYNFEELFLYSSLKAKLSKLSNQQKYWLRAMVIAGPTFTFDTNYPAERRFSEYMQSPWMFQRNLKNNFQKSGYRYRD